MKHKPDVEQFKHSLAYRRKVGKAIVKAREEDFMTAKDLADEMGLTLEQVEDLESGESKAHGRMMEIADWLGVECPEQDRMERVSKW